VKLSVPVVLLLAALAIVLKACHAPQRVDLPTAAAPPVVDAEGRVDRRLALSAGLSPGIPGTVAALDHIARTAPDLPVPRIEPGGDGELLQSVDLPGGRSLMRLVSYLPGVPVGDVASTPGLRRHLGATLAALGRALQGFFHPAARHPLLWDVNQTAAVSGLCVHIEERRGRELAERVFARHAARGGEVLAALRAQVIHNDFNPDNLLVNVDDPERVSGIIDFGDMVHAPLVNDLAVLAAYQVVGHDDELAVLAVLADIAAAFHAVRTLEPAEVDVLFHLVQLRLAASTAICAWRAREHPDNVDYILGGHEASLRTMERLEAIDEREATRVLRRVFSPNGTPRPLFVSPGSIPVQGWSPGSRVDAIACLPRGAPVAMWRPLSAYSRGGG